MSQFTRKEGEIVAEGVCLSDRPLAPRCAFRKLAGYHRVSRWCEGSVSTGVPVGERSEMSEPRRKRNNKGGTGRHK